VSVNKVTVRWPATRHSINPCDDKTVCPGQAYASSQISRWQRSCL